MILFFQNKIACQLEWFIIIVTNIFKRDAEQGMVLSKAFVQL
jgi:hypothetical protein